MELELLMKLAARLRNLTENEFVALRDLVERGEEQDEHLDAASQALVDCLDISEAHQRGWRVVPAA